MRKAFQNNFHYFFFLILILHITFLSLHLHKLRSDSLSVNETTKIIKVKILRDAPNRQVVASEDPDTVTTPKENAYLSDKTRSFDRQTRARIVDRFQKGTSAKGSRGKRGQKNLSLGALGGEIAKNNPFEKAAREYTQARRENKQFAGGPGGRSISATNDHLTDIPEGDLTHLNTVEYKFYGYYYRIRQKLEGFWGRSVQEKAALLSGQGRMVSDEELVTALRIVMNAEGEIVDVVILGSSGVQELDDAAIESFNEAGPFPNPPKDLIVDGRVTIEWGFVVNS